METAPRCPGNRTQCSRDTSPHLGPFWRDLRGSESIAHTINDEVSESERVHWRSYFLRSIQISSIGISRSTSRPVPLAVDTCRASKRGGSIRQLDLQGGGTHLCSAPRGSSRRAARRPGCFLRPVDLCQNPKGRRSCEHNAMKGWTSASWSTKIAIVTLWPLKFNVGLNLWPRLEIKQIVY